MQIKLTAYANPYAALDHYGRAQCVVYRIGTHNPIGATFDHEAHEASKADTVSGEGKLLFAFTGEAETLVCNNVAELSFYRNCFRDGALIPGDAATAKKLGLEFVEPAKALAAAKDAAIKAFRDAYGIDPACAEAPKPAATTKTKPADTASAVKE